MRKLLLILTSFTIVGTSSLNAISCTSREVGWQANRDYWMVINYDQFFQWMHQVDLISQGEWEDSSLTDDQKEESWKTLTNVDLNNFMSAINLAYKYLSGTSNDGVSVAPKEPVDNLGGFYNNFAYAVLDSNQSFAKHIEDIKYGDDGKSIIAEKWNLLDHNTYINSFKNSELSNQFQFQDLDKEKQPITMTVTSDDTKTLPRKEIVENWKETAVAISSPSRNDEEFIKELWSNLRDKMFESFIFKINFYLPVEESPYVSFQFNLGFDF